MATSSLLSLSSLRGLVPDFIKDYLRHRVDYAALRSAQCREGAVARAGDLLFQSGRYESPYPITIGIFPDSSYSYAHNVLACSEEKVRYTLIDIEKADWKERVRASGCDAFMATPSQLLTIWKTIYDERLKVLVEEMGIDLTPSYNELWMWESKRRMEYWMDAHDVSRARTLVCHSRDEAMAALDSFSLPLVVKLDLGANGNGVFVVRSRAHAERLITKMFTRGIDLPSMDRRNWQVGYILLQEYVPHDYEYRIVRIGETMMCRRKERVGDYASGSGEILWAEPMPEMLDFVWDLTEMGGFTSMSTDLFVLTEQGRPRFLVNELQALVGPIVDETKTNAHMGRWLRSSDGTWAFEPGFFYRNACANLRVRMILQRHGLLP